MCVFSCAEVSCPAATACFDGLCQDVGCAPLGCTEDNEVCIGNVCTEDPCTMMSCDQAEICYLGECLPDPCIGVICPEYQKCELIFGTAQCVANWPVINEEPMESMPDTTDTDSGNNLDLFSENDTNSPTDEEEATDESYREVDENESTLNADFGFLELPELPDVGALPERSIGQTKGCICFYLCSCIESALYSNHKTVMSSWCN